MGLRVRPRNDSLHDQCRPPARRRRRDDDKAAELLGSKFPKLPLHSIACIGALLAERVEDRWQVRSLGAPHIGDRTEAELIGAFADRLQALRPTLVSYNGHGFDLPVLRYRAMVNAIVTPGLSPVPTSAATTTPP